MAEIRVSEDITVEDFFEKHVPRQFAEAVSGTDLSFLGDRGFTLQFRVGEKVYCVRVDAAQGMDVVSGGVEKPLLEIALSEEDWRDAVTGKIEGVLDTFTDPAQIEDAARYERLLATKGTMHLKLTKGDGSIMPVTMAFNGEASPAVTITLDLPNWVAMQRKEVNGTTLFMSGKMQTQGDMMFLMSLQTLL